MSKTYKILLVEDDVNFGMVLKSYLELNDFSVTLKQDGYLGLVTFKKENFDLCILDVMMPNMDGFTLAGEIKKMEKQVPILFLTAKNLKEDVLQGFKLGAEDYIIKPFDTEIFLYKIKAILKRNNFSKPEIEVPTEHNIGKSLFNTKLRTVQIGENNYKLSPKESELLQLLCQYKNDVLPREEALVKIWKDDNYFTTRSMDVYITKLRKYFREDPNIQINNVHSNGFSLTVQE